MGDYLDDGRLINIYVSQPASFAELFDRHYTALRSFCARRVEAHEVDDVTGETFCRAFEHRGRYDVTRRDARPWLYGIALNIIRVEQRSFTRGARANARHGMRSDPISDPATSIEAIDAARDLAIVARALASIPQDEAEVLLMFVWERLRYDEIAQALDAPIGTVRSRLFRARKRLRASLDATNVCRSHS
jgi:RNA polymerase sigma factor (sigma-70 family)